MGWFSVRWWNCTV